MSAQKKKKNILVVDDETVLLDLLEEILSGEGFVVYTAADSEKALEIIHRQPVHILMTDVRISASNGIDLACKAREVSPQTSIIFITGSIDLSVMKTIPLRPSEYHLIEKPFGVEDVVGLIKQISTLSSPASV